jgi:hypothetical protein
MMSEFLSVRTRETGFGLRENLQIGRAGRGAIDAEPPKSGDAPQKNALLLAAVLEENHESV